MIGDMSSEFVWKDCRAVAVDVVLGRSMLFPRVEPELRKTFNIGARRMVSEAACGPNEVELVLANLSKLVDLTMAVKGDSSSAEKALCGNVSTA